MSDRLSDYNNELGRLKTFITWPDDSPAWPSALARAGFYYQGNCDETRCHRCGCVVRGWQDRGDPFEEHWRENPHCSYLAETIMKNEAARLGTFVSWSLGHLVRPVQLARAGLYFVGPADRVKCAFCQNVLLQWEEGDIPELEHRRHFPDCPFVQGRDVGNIPINQGAASTNNTPLVTQPTTLPQEHIDNRSTSETLSSSSDDSSFGNNRSTIETLGPGSDDSSSDTNPTWGDFEALDMSCPEFSPVFDGFQEIQPVFHEIPEPPQGSKAQSLVAENRQLREERLCKVCFVEEANLAFLPCGHLCSCANCLSRLNRCPLCRSEYSGTVSVERT